MKRDTFERWVLLKQSGELCRWKDWLLTRRLARDPALQAFAQDAGDLGLLSRSRAPGALPDGIVDAIHARLEAPADRRAIIAPAPEPNGVWRPAFALAICVILLAAGGVFWWRGDAPVGAHPTAAQESDRLAWNDALDGALDEVDAWLAGDWTGADAVPARLNRNGEEEQLVRELLALEGITI
jgi:hypothetical protein